MQSAERLLEWIAGAETPDAARLTPAEWDALVAEAVAHTVVPQLFARMAASRGTPPAAMQGAFAAMIWQKQQAARLTNELPAVLCALNAAGITPLLLKGAQLATSVYPDPSHRPMRDIDLLVRVDELARSEEALQALGYESDRALPIDVICEKHRHLPELRKESALPVEIHWAISDPRDPVSIDLDALRARAADATLFDARVRLLAPEDLLLYVCLHGAAINLFGEKGLRPLLDIAAIIARYGGAIDWDGVIRRAAEWRIRRSAYLLLDLARRHCAAAVPADVLARLAPAKIAAAVRNAARRELFERPGTRLPVDPLPIALFFSRPRHWLARVRTPSDSAGPARRASRHAWSYVVGLYRNRGAFAIVAGRAWRKMLLNAWLTEKS